jgi:hypothetical protein
MKKCTKCGETKPFAEYHKHKNQPDGYNQWCKTCKHGHYAANEARYVERARLWAEKHPERALELDRLAAIRNREKNRERAKVTYLKSKERYKQYHAAVKDSPDRKAREKVNYALRHKMMTKPSRCQDCGQEKPSRQIHGHHEDYSKPLSVEWLCAVCHGRRHWKAAA